MADLNLAPRLAPRLAPTVGVVVTSATDAAVRAAVSQVQAAGGGTVYLPAGTISLSAPLPVFSGLRYQGVQPLLSYPNNIPDSDWSLVGGTILLGNGTFECFSANDTAQSTPGASPFPSNAITGFGIDRVGINNFTNGISIGASNNIGLIYSDISNIWVTNCSGWGIELINFMHTWVRRIWSYNNQNGQRYSCISDVLSSGNAKVEQLYTIIPHDGRNNLLCRGLVFEAQTGGSGIGDMNEIFAERLQVNRFNQTQLSQTATFTSSSTSVTVTNGSLFAVNLPVTFTTNAAGFVAGRTYIVLSVSGNTLTLGTSRAATAITATANTTSTITSWGMPCMEVVTVAGGAGSTITASRFLGIDIEGASQAALYIEGAVGCTFDIAQVPHATGGMDIVMRNAAANQINSRNTANTDFDNASCVSEFRGYRGINAQCTGVGQWYDSTLSANVLAIQGYSTGNTNDIIARYSGSAFLYPTTPYGMNVNSSGTTSFTINANQCGLHVVNLSTASTRTLPTIVNTNAANSTIGLFVRFVNCGSGTLTVSTDGTQLFNGVASKTAYSVPAGCVLDVTAVQDTVSHFFWAAFPGPGVS